MRSKGCIVPASPSLVASRRQILVTPVSDSASTLRRMAARASALSSTNRQKRAPRDIASSPSAPEPANRSSTRASGEIELRRAVLEHVEQRLAHAVRCRPRGEPLRRLDALGSELAGYDSHERGFMLIAAAPLAAFGSRCSSPSSAASVGAQLIHEHALLDLAHLASRQIPERERPEGDADQAVDGEAERFGEPLHLAVLAFAKPKRQPDIARLARDRSSLPPARNCTPSMVMPLGKLVEVGLRHLAVRPHAIAPKPAGARQLEMASQARRRW